MILGSFSDNFIVWLDILRGFGLYTYKYIILVTYCIYLIVNFKT